MRMDVKPLFARLKRRLSRLSFKTGIVVLCLCVACYIISFAQAALPIGIGLKGVLWVVFFGLAKTFQYAGLLIIGKEGIKRLKNKFRNKKIELQ